MKIGRDRQPLSARLAEKMETETDQAADWLESHLKSFRTDCAAISKNAHDTIASDMAATITSVCSTISENLEEVTTNLQLIRRLTQFGPWLVTGLVIMLIASIFITTYWWGRSMIREALATNYQEIGLATHFTQSGLVISWNQTKLTLSECSNGEAIVPCLIPTKKSPK